MRLADSGKEVHGALVRQEIQELPMQTAGGRRDQGQESLFVLQVVEAVVVHLALGSVDEHAIGVLSMPKRSVATDVVAGAVELMDHGDVDDQVSLVGDVCIPNLEVASPCIKPLSMSGANWNLQESELHTGITAVSGELRGCGMAGTPPPTPPDDKAAWVLGCCLYVVGSVVVNLAQVGSRACTQEIRRPCITLCAARLRGA